MAKKIITDHALLRWLEREHEIEVEWFRERLREEVEPFLRMKSVGFPIGNSCWGRAAQGGILATVIKKQGRAGRPPRKQTSRGAI